MSLVPQIARVSWHSRHKRETSPRVSFQKGSVLGFRESETSSAMGHKQRGPGREAWTQKKLDTDRVVSQNDSTILSLSFLICKVGVPIPALRSLERCKQGCHGLSTTQGTRKFSSLPQDIGEWSRECLPASPKSGRPGERGGRLVNNLINGNHHPDAC